MTSKPKNRPIVIRPPHKMGTDALLKNFLEGYDYLSWVNRAAFLDLVISQPELCNKVEATTKAILGNNGPVLSSERIVKTAKLEMHFAAYHSTESLLGLLFAFMFDPSAPWIWLTQYRAEFGKLVNKLAKEGLAGFTTNGNAEVVAKALFINAKDEKLQGDIDHSIKFVVDYLKMLAKEFQDKDDYNAYKHGLRTLTPQDFKLKLMSQSATPIQLKWEELTTTYLVIGQPVEWKNDLVSDLKIVTKAIDYERSKRIIITNTHLMHNLFEIKKALTYGTTQINLHLFGQENAFDILGPSKKGNIMKKMVVSPEPLKPQHKLTSRKNS